VTKRKIKLKTLASGKKQLNDKLEKGGIKEREGCTSHDGIIIIHLHFALLS
jgi:hypothetical protein